MGGAPEHPARCIKQSMGRVGSALDNAVIEAWHSTFECELRGLERFVTKATALIRVGRNTTSPGWQTCAEESRHAREILRCG
jgi:hypothetical protein